METIHVLLINDNAEDIQEIRDLLTTGPDDTLHYHIDTTADYAETMRALVRNKHDIALIDYHLPGTSTSGVELLQRANAGGCSIPVILMSTLADGDIEWAAEDAGAACYLNKNFDMTERTLKLAIRHGVRYFKKLQEMQELLTTVQKQLVDLGRKFKRA